ncbi:hypothetical protein JCM19239_3272 [Vibrio variabilis]|uniref:Uncharacterized protein n=1 Tax=Vibrio variabilis TaxID=990271 RepID=A0ABQ0JG02_9VIBR|nr:hypothetical protein JCM19239_3272 [Vibrio variabilis]
MILRKPFALTVLTAAMANISAVSAQPFDYENTTDNYSQYFGAANVPKDTTIAKDNGNWVLLEFNKGGESNVESS